MPRTPDDPADPDIRDFFQRWSERKLRTREAAPAGEQEPATADADSSDMTVRGSTDPATDEIGAGEGARAPTVSEADLEGLTYQSDYTKFMGDGVPDAIRQRALRQLWRSDPILANVDGLCDYDLDYTDAALAVDVLKTAYKVGQGYLTDDDLAANRARGEPQGVDEEGETIADADADACEAANGETGQGDAAAADGDGAAETAETVEAEVDGASEMIAADDTDSGSGGSGGEMAAVVVAKQTRDAG